MLCRCGADGEFCDTCVNAGDPDELLVEALEEPGDPEHLTQGLALLAAGMVVARAATDIEVARELLDREALLLAEGQEQLIDLWDRLRADGSR
ncbi:hypothetical protein VO63_31875 [Streptomyces showdoensis]|uniref:Uncharacterized protein n=2 Tax=Streptomyces showdoensis TaxID=68268 RepID=A0A2P2GEF4_STREW|nr:hypothetical protein VO63_31875 [Streptomyces showdoensis]